MRNNHGSNTTDSYFGYTLMDFNICRFHARFPCGRHDGKCENCTFEILFIFRLEPISKHLRNTKWLMVSPNSTDINCANHMNSMSFKNVYSHENQLFIQFFFLHFLLSHCRSHSHSSIIHFAANRHWVHFSILYIRNYIRYTYIK